MRLDPNVTASDLEPILRQHAEILYGTERTEELSDRIEHLSRMLATVARRDLSIRGVPPDLTGITDWRGE